MKVGNILSSLELLSVGNISMLEETKSRYDFLIYELHGCKELKGKDK